MSKSKSMLCIRNINCLSGKDSLFKKFCSNDLPFVSRLQYRRYLCFVHKRKRTLHSTSLSTGIWKRGHVTKQVKLDHVGILENIKSDANYSPGQMFLHRVFGYRGVILYPWTAHIYEKNSEVTAEPNKENEKSEVSKPVPVTETFYQVLVDARDSPHVAVQSEAVTFLTNSQPGENNHSSLYTIPGIDYVSQHDILPYTSVEPLPMSHELFPKFLEAEQTANGTVLSTTETLASWQKKNHFCLELTKVHIETTDNIRVTAIPFYLGAKESRNSLEYWWRYCIRIENLGETGAHLRERHWRIISNGSVKTVRGRGVIGREPMLNKSQPAFQYSSHVSLQSSSGHMWGIFRLEQEDGKQFDARIPAFALDGNKTTKTEP
ncbi:polymerase delta-interacting protein 2-like [Ciona intestinalis]